jgi:penicillin amidase
MMRHFVSFMVLLVVAPFYQAGEPTKDLLRKAKGVLAQIDGKIGIKGLKEPVEVLRDQWGIAHIYAKNTDDLFFAQGFVAAQDRLFQLDMWRRLTVGELAEVIGEEGVPSDRFARLLRYRGDMDAEWKSYSPDTQQIATAFTRGINAYIDQVGNKLPIEFQILGFAPGQWQPEDILGRMSGIIMSRNFTNEIARARLIQTVGLEKARLLAPTDPQRDFAPAPGLDLDGIDSKILAGFSAISKSLQFKPSKSESNNWVIDGNLSSSGKPMLASDPHRAIAVPSLRYLVHLHAPGWNVIGSGEPALPGVALGHNERIAWGFTIVGTDQADLYVEKVDPRNPFHYQVGDKWEPMKVVREKIQVKDFGPWHVELRFTRHGPVLYHDDQRAFALRWSGSEPGGAAYLGSLAVGRAQNRQEFLKALESWKIPGLNFVYADVEGTIGWVAAALTPIRKGWDGLLPVPGEKGANEWQGFLPVKDLPQAFNPQRHWLATANHNILPAGYKHEIAYDWSPPYRFRRIEQRLNEKKKFTLEDFKSIQHENTSLPGLALIKLLSRLQTTDPNLVPFVKLLESWDGVLSRESQAGPLYAVWLQELMKSFFGSYLSKEAPEVMRSTRNITVLLGQLEKPDPRLFGKGPEEVRDKMLRDTFKKAVERTRTLLGEDMSQWRWGKLHTVTFRHPLANLGPEYAKLFNLGPVPRPGDGNTPNNTLHDDTFQQIHGASYRHLFDLADWDRGLATSTPGQSGQPGSPHYADLLPLWAEFQYFPLYYSRGKVEDATKHRLQLMPGN